MVKSSVNVSSITFAQRGRDILEAKGYTAFFEKTRSLSGGSGCGYSIYTNAPQNELESILGAAGVKFIPALRGGAEQ